MKKIIALCGAIFVLASCGGGEKIEPQQPLTQIYATAYDEFNDKNYDAAATEFLKAESQYPSSPWAADALVMAAYSHYLDDDFAGACRFEIALVQFCCTIS